MIFSIGIFLLVTCAPWHHAASGFAIPEASVGKTEHDRPNEIHRSRRSLEKSSSRSTQSIRQSYETAMNKTISDYYAQRKAVMDRYYARQREIVEKFRKNTSTTRSETTIVTTNPSIVVDEATIRDAKFEISTISLPIVDNENIDVVTERSAMADGAIGGSEKNSKSSNENSREMENGSDADIQSDLQANIRDHSEAANLPGYYKLGDFKLTNDEKIVYQHNLGIVPKGPSQLEATFDVVLEGNFAITAIEAFPYANTRADFTWISGGPGAKSVKLKLRGRENEGFSYTIKVWGVPL